MIVFDLKCRRGHRFEGWFRSHEDFSAQQEAAAIACPDCGASDISKGFSAPNIGGVSSARREENDERRPEALPRALNAPSLPPAIEAELGRVLTRIREHVETSCENVGSRFAEEARRIHYGEVAERGIYGVATPAESDALAEEGIAIMPLPIPVKSDA